MAPSSLYDLIIKLRTTSKQELQDGVPSIIKELEAETTVVHEVYFQFAVRLKALLDQWCDASMTSFVGEIDSLFTIVDEEKGCHTIDTFRDNYTPLLPYSNETLRTTCDI